MLGRHDARLLLERALKLSQAKQTEAVLIGLEEQLTRFANNSIHQHVAETNRYVIVRAVLGRQVGVSATNDLTREGLERVVERATAAARLRPEDPDFPGLPEPNEFAPVAAFDEETAACTPVQRAHVVDTVCRNAIEAGVNAAGAFRTGVHEWAVANSHGLFVHTATTEADATVVAMAEGEGSGFATDASWRVGEIDLAACGNEAIAKALRSRYPQAALPRQVRCRARALRYPRPGPDAVFRRRGRRRAGGQELDERPAQRATDVAAHLDLGRRS